MDDPVERALAEGRITRGQYTWAKEYAKRDYWAFCHYAASIPSKKPTVLPEWIRVLPTGRLKISGHHCPIMVDEASLETLVAAYRSRGADLAVDYDITPQGPAAGWIKNLEARSDGLWARVDWTKQARDYLEKKEYRYFSPVLRLDPETRKPTVLIHVGLTNVPAINYYPLSVQCEGEPEQCAANVMKAEAAAQKCQRYLREMRIYVNGDPCEPLPDPR